MSTIVLRFFSKAVAVPRHFLFISFCWLGQPGQSVFTCSYVIVAMMTIVLLLVF